MAAAKPKSNSTTKKKDAGIVFDVSKPGKSAPAASSKPIIVTNRPILQDPMVVDAAATAEPGTATATSSTSTHKVNIKPITVTSDEDNNDAVAVSSGSETVTADGSTEEPAAQISEPVSDPSSPEVATTAEESSIPEAETEASQPVDSPATTEAAAETPDVPAEEEVKEDESTSEIALSPEDKDAAAKEAEKQATEHEAAIQKLAESKQYYLPINSIEQRRVRQFIALGALLILVLAAAWVDVALDAGLIKISGLHALTHFFGA